MLVLLLPCAYQKTSISFFVGCIIIILLFILLLPQDSSRISSIAHLVQVEG